MAPPKLGFQTSKYTYIIHILFKPLSIKIDHFLTAQEYTVEI